MTDIEHARAHLREIADRAEAGDLFCVKTLGAIVLLIEHLMGGPDDDGGTTVEDRCNNVIDLFELKRAA